MLPTTVDHCNTHGRNARRSYGARYDDNARVTAAVRMLLNQADPRRQAKVRGKLWEWREPWSASMYSSPSCRCPYADDPRAWLHAGLWVIPVLQKFIYDWRLLKLSAANMAWWYWPNELFCANSGCYSWMFVRLFLCINFAYANSYHFCFQ